MDVLTEAAQILSNNTSRQKTVADCSYAELIELVKVCDEMMVYYGNNGVDARKWRIHKAKFLNYLEERVNLLLDSSSF